MPARSPLRIAVTGLAATYPFGGVFWDYLQYALGFLDLGHDVLYIEDTGRWRYDPVAATFTESGENNAGYLQEHLRFDDSLLLMSHRLGWADVPVYYPMNVNVRSAENSPLDPALADLVRSRSALDVDLYCFAAELLAQQISELGERFFQSAREYRDRKQAWYATHGVAQPQST